ncbi:MAG: hypothetical protein IJ387_11985, partial [Thermoguttaceae bacterium]|nr:hypothetical protein [Thermoguttaceae bacterium]
MKRTRKIGAKWAAACVGVALAAGASVASANDETGKKVGETAKSASVATDVGNANGESGKNGVDKATDG